MKRFLYLTPIIILLLIIRYYTYNYLNPTVIDVLNSTTSTNEVYNLMKKSTYYNEKYKEDYEKINFVDRDNFEKEINTFLEKGYIPKEINNIYLLSNKNIEKLTTMEKTDFEKYIEIKNFDVLNIDRYNDYGKKHDLDLQTLVTHVNINLDKDWYSVIEETPNQREYYAIVNKFYKLSENYEPSDLVYIDGTRQMRKEAAEEYKKLQKDANEAGLKIEPRSGYRSYKTQVSTYNYWVSTNGKSVADASSARAGHSEHQTGLVMDVINRAHKEATGENVSEADAAWLRENSHKYGFIVRFPKGKTNITGYIHEPWHLRYLGKDLATKVYESKLTYDEYYDLYIKEY